MFTTIVISLYVVGALIPLGVAATVVRRAVQHGDSIGGLKTFLNDVLAPRQAWIAFTLVALGVGATTAASIMSLSC